MPKLAYDSAALASAASGAAWLLGGWLMSWASQGRSLGETQYALIISTTLVVSCLVYLILWLFRVPAPSRQLVQHFLRVAREGLPHDFRAHVMRLDGRLDDADATFKFIATFNMDEDLSKYKAKIQAITPGVGSAFVSNKLVHLEHSNFDKSLADIDPWPKNIFSKRIDDTKCVVTFDTNAIALTNETIVEIQSTIVTLTDILSNYDIDRLAPVR